MYIPDDESNTLSMEEKNWQRENCQTKRGGFVKFPYGISDLAVIRKENYLYVDKTKYIEKLEIIGRYLFFIRPRRFGKSLFLSTLEHYYDLNQGKEFAELFGDLYIGKEPTPWKNSCFILKLNFSGLKQWIPL